MGRAPIQLPVDPQHAFRMIMWDSSQQRSTLETRRSLALKCNSPHEEVFGSVAASGPARTCNRFPGLATRATAKRP
jgi:hypothetical protein